MTVPWVRIPPSPPEHFFQPSNDGIFFAQESHRHCLSGRLLCQSMPSHTRTNDGPFDDATRKDRAALTDIGVKSRKPGVHADAGPDRVRGLYLRVSGGKARYWFCRLVVNG